MKGLAYSAGTLAPLQGLSELRTLLVGSGAGQAVREVVQLEVDAPMAAQGLLLQLAQLRQLTKLLYHGPIDSNTVVTLTRVSQVRPDPLHSADMCGECRMCRNWGRGVSAVRSPVFSHTPCDTVA